jgi:hypothetical protein
MTTWKPMLDVIRRRIGSWGNKYLSFGGRIVMVNAVLNAIPIFYLSYLKMPSNMRKEVVRIQQKFLWSGLSNRSKISWVKWEDVCKPKKEGGLGVRDLRLTNISLLAKWRWKLLQSENDFWKDILVSKYGAYVVGKKNLGADDISRTGSTWWSNICLLDNNVRLFDDGVDKIVGNMQRTSFWQEAWVGNQSLAARFPRLFSVSMQQQGMISQMGRMEASSWQWNLFWRREFFEWEVPMFQELLGLIEGFQPLQEEDRWRWKADPDVGLTAKSAYQTLLLLQRQEGELSMLQKYCFNNIWKSVAPSKVIAFTWQLLLDRIPTKNNLILRRIACDGGTVCPLCNGYDESSIHLFFHCEFAAKVWYEIVKWVGQALMLPPTVSNSLSMFIGCGAGKKGMLMIWYAYIWTLWRMRNNRIFNNGIIYAEDAVETIKRLSWQWFIGRMATAPCLFYEWRWNPGVCFNRR